MRVANRLGIAAAGVAAVVVLAGCGSSDGTLLSTGAATQLTSELNQATSALDAYNCDVAYTALTNFKDDVNQLTGVNTTLVEMLSQGASRISTLANERCPSGVSSDTTTSARSTTTTTGATTSTTVTTTSSAPTTTTSGTTTGTGGATPTTDTAPPVVTSETVTTATGPTTSPNSGGAGLNGSSGSTAGGDGQ